MANVILKNISGSSLSLDILAKTPVAKLTNNQTINLLQYISLEDATKSLQTGELKKAFANNKILLTKNSLGFIKKTASIINASISGNNIYFTISPTGTSFSYNQQVDNGSGLEIVTCTVSTTNELSIPLTTGTSSFYSVYYYNRTLSYQNLSTTSSTSFSDVLNVNVCNLWYDANTNSVWIFDQRQEYYTDWSENILKDSIQQIKYKSGLQLVNGSTDGYNGQVQITPGIIIQNTSEVSISKTIQTLDPLSTKILYRKDTIINKKGCGWTIFDPSPFNNIVYYKFDTGEVGYNSYGDYGWLISKASTNYYVSYWIVGTNCLNCPIMIIMGQDQYATLTDAQYQSRFDKLSLDNNTFRSFKPLYRLIVQNAATPIVVDVTDLRNKQLIADYIGASSKGGGTSLPAGENNQLLHWASNAWNPTNDVLLPLGNTRHIGVVQNDSENASYGLSITGGDSSIVNAGDLRIQAGDFIGTNGTGGTLYITGGGSIKNQGASVFIDGGTSASAHYGASGLYGVSGDPVFVPVYGTVEIGRRMSSCVNIGNTFNSYPNPNVKFYGFIDFGQEKDSSKCYVISDINFSKETDKRIAISQATDLGSNGSSLTIAAGDGSYNTDAEHNVGTGGTLYICAGNAGDDSIYNNVATGAAGGGINIIPGTGYKNVGGDLVLYSGIPGGTDYRAGNIVIQPSANTNTDLAGKFIINNNSNSNGYLGFFVQSGEIQNQYAAIVYDKSKNKWVSRIDNGTWVDLNKSSDIQTEVLVAQGLNNNIGLNNIDYNSLTYTEFTSSSNGGITSIQYLGNGQVIAQLDSANPKIAKSYDYGKTWKTILIAPAFSTSVCLSIIYLGNGVVLSVFATPGYPDYKSRFYKSTDYGETWTALSVLSSPNTYVTRPKFIKCNGNVLLLTFNDNYNPTYYIMRSTDNGLTWTNVKSFSYSQNVSGGVYCDNGIIIIPTGKNGSNNAVRSIDNGLTWTDINIDTNWTALNYSWIQGGLCYCGNGVVLVGESSNGDFPIARSTDYGLTWTKTSTLFKPISHITYIGNGHVLTFAYDAMYESYDYGVTWTKTSITNLGNSLTHSSVKLDTGTILIGTGGSYPKIYKLNNGSGIKPSNLPYESVLFASTQNTSNYNWTRVATKPINGNYFPMPTFYAVLERSATTFNVECKLFNRTLGTDVANSLITISTSDLGPIKCSSSITLPANEYLYDILFHITTTTPGQSDICGISFAGLVNI